MINRFLTLVAFGEKSFKIIQNPFYISVRFDLWSPPSHLGHSSELDGSRFVVGC
jgi:hypothetical protein